MIATIAMTLPPPEELLAAALRCSPESILPGSALGVHPNWDSFGHMSLMLELEKHYGIEISDDTIRKYETFAMIRTRYEELLKA